MNDDKGIMKYEAVLPANFTGVFHFSNPTDEEFVGIWGKKEYHFPAQTTSAMIMPEYTPLEVQHIRKKFAKDLAEREFFKSDGYGTLRKQEKNDDGSVRLNSIMQAGTYSVDNLTPFIQRCLEPLPAGQTVVTESIAESIEDKLSRNDEGGLNTEAIDKKTSLKSKALAA
jgi:hypothetical protein